MDNIIFLAIILVCFIIAVYVIVKKAAAEQKTDTRLKDLENNSAQKSYDLVLERIERAIGSVPESVLRSVKGSVSDMKGHMGELISYVQVRSQYDRLIVLGDICDFIGIKFPKDSNPGHIHFIDIKAGKFARLSKDQIKLKKIIEKGDFEFQKISVSIDTLIKKETHEEEKTGNNST